MLKINKKKIKPYGDRLDDGAMQLSFTLPVEASVEVREAARLLVKKLGLRDVSIVEMEPMGKGFTYFVAYGYCKDSIDLTKIKVQKIQAPVMDFQTLKDYMALHLKDPITVIGATTGSDAHTVGIDAIMNMKGFDHDYGLERYPLFKAYNLRSQLTNEQLLDKAVELKADAVLVSQVVTQRDSHIDNLKQFHALWKKDKRIDKKLMVIIGGPRLDHAQAVKLGFDAGFGAGTKPSQVASFLVKEYMKRHGIKERSAGEQVEKYWPEKPSDDRPLPVTMEGSTAKPRSRGRAASQKEAAPEAEGRQQGAKKKKKSRRGRRGGRRRNKNRNTTKE